MPEHSKQGKSIFFWVAVLAAVALALFVIAKFLFPQLIEKFTALLVGLFVVVTGLVFRKKRKNA